MVPRIKKSQLAHICKRHRYPNDIRINGYPLTRIKIPPYETKYIIMR